MNVIKLQMANRFDENEFPADENRLLSVRAIRETQP